jgi:hypothetical protein
MNRSICNLKKNIILVGFQGAKPKHLKLYKNMYEDFGFKNINIIYPNYLENYDVRKVQPLGINIYNQLMDNDKTIVHCMSGGMYPLSYTIKYLLWSNNLNKIDKLILDSSPVMASHDSLLNAFMVHNKLKYSKPLLDFFLKLYYKTIFLEMDTWSYDFNFLMNSKQFNTPKLFIHSKNDIIAPSHYINSIVDSQLNHGNITKQLLLEDSEHAKHIRLNETIYKEKILDFIK